MATRAAPPPAGGRLEGGFEPRSDRYLRSLFWLLIAASFFEGYDSSILALVLPDIQETFDVAESQLGVSRGFIELGLFFAFFLARLGDRIGRRALLLWSVFGYTFFTTLTVVSWDLWSFTVFQSLARVFFGAEYAVAVTMIVEEFPVHRRSTALGRLLMMTAAGALAVAVFLVAGVDQTALGWRVLYLIGVAPLLVLGWFRRRVKETVRFERLREQVRRGGRVRRRSFWEPWERESRGNLTLVGSLHLLRALPIFAANAWFFFYAQREAGVERILMFVIFIGAFGLGILGYALCGVLMERIGRRPTAVVYASGALVFPVLLFQSRSVVVIAVGLVAAVFFGLGQQPLFGAMATELFPTRIRNQAMAWSRNVFEIGGFILGPLVVGVVGDHYSGLLGSVGDTVTFLIVIGFVPAVWLMWRYLPETRGRELDVGDDDGTGDEVDAGVDAEVEAAGAVMEVDVERGAPRGADEGSPVAATDGRDAPAGGRATPPVRVRHRRTLLGVAVGLFVVGLVVGGLQAANEVVRRPEGAAERFLRGVSDENAGAVEEYGDATLAAELTSRLFTRDDPDGDWFSASEVGRRLGDPEGSEAVPSPGTARVPFRAVLEDGDGSQLYGLLEVEELSGRGDPAPWRVVGVEALERVSDETGTGDTGDTRDAAISGLVPSGGGPEPASAGALTWAVALAVAVGVALGLEALVRAAGGVRTRSGQGVASG